MYTFEPEDGPVSAPGADVQWTFEPQEDFASKEASRDSQDGQASVARSPGWLTWISGNEPAGADEHMQAAAPSRSRDSAPPPLPYSSSSEAPPAISRDRGPSSRNVSRDSDGGVFVHFPSDYPNDTELRRQSREQDAEPRPSSALAAAPEKGLPHGSQSQASSSRLSQARGSTASHASVVPGNNAGGRYSINVIDTNQAWSSGSTPSQPSQIGRNTTNGLFGGGSELRGSELQRLDVPGAQGAQGARPSNFSTYGSYGSEVSFGADSAHRGGEATSVGANDVAFRGSDYYQPQSWEQQGQARPSWQPPSQRRSPEVGQVLSPRLEGDETSAASEEAADAPPVRGRIPRLVAYFERRIDQARHRLGRGDDPSPEAEVDADAEAGEDDAFEVRPLHERLLLRYVKSGPGRCPCCCVCLGFLIVVLTVALGVLLRPPDVETNFDSFMKTDVNTSTMRDTFLYALGKRAEGRRLQDGSVLYKHFDLEIVYDLKEGSDTTRGLLDIEILSEIARFEQKLRDLPMWMELCNGSEEWDIPLCSPGMSFISYTMPSPTVADGQIVPTSLRFDGSGREPIPLEAAVRIAEDLNIAGVMLPIDFTQTTMSTNQLRSVFRFKFRCCTSLDSMSYQRQVVGALTAKWKQFSTDHLLPLLQSAGQEISVEVGEQTQHPVQIYWSGAGLEQIEVMQALMGDAYLAAGSVGFVLFYIMLHTKSLFVSIVGLLIISLSVPFSYVVYAVVTGSAAMSIASFLSLFLIVGLGSDVVFVYTDFWQESKRVKNDLNARMAWTLWNAGKASFATTATTAVSFFANLASVLKPLREFGFFMGLCVLLAWVLLTLVFVPFCLLNEKYAFNRILICCFPVTCRERFIRIQESSGTTRIFGRLAHFLRSWRRTILATTVILTITFLTWAGLAVTTDTGVPNIFPKDHNQNRGKEVFSAFRALGEIFDPLFPAPRGHTSVCRSSDFGQTHAHCELFWCEAKPDTPQTQEGRCDCYKKPSTVDCGEATQVRVVQRLVGPGDVTQALLEGPISSHIVLNSSGSVQFQAGDRRNFMSRTNIAGPLVLQEWESGAVELERITQVESTLTRTNSAECGWEEMCFCGTYTCKLSGEWQRNSMLHLAVQGQRRLTQQPVWTIASNMRATVEVIFGIEVSAESPLLGELDLASAWQFSNRHEVRQPWAQRNMYSFCNNLPQELRVTSRRCWIEEFRRYVIHRGMRFPLPREQFDSEVLRFGATTLTGLSSSQDYLWIRGGQVKASYISFSIDVFKYAPTGLALEHKQKWDDYLNSYNAEASRFARGAWHTASLWVRAEAQDELIMSTVVTLLIVILLAFFGMVVFTRNAALSLSVVLATVGVIGNLFFFITVVMGWPIGPIEVIALIVFIGYAVTYSLHIAHRYGSGDALAGGIPPDFSETMSEDGAIRFQRSLFALQTIGSAALGSAVTTIGCSIFLIFCTLTIFKKLGGVVLAVTLMSIVMALGPLPAALISVGPTAPGRRCLPSISDIVSGFTSAKESFVALLAWRPSFKSADSPSKELPPAEDPSSPHEPPPSATSPSGRASAPPTPSGTSDFHGGIQPRQSEAALTLAAAQAQQVSRHTSGPPRQPIGVAGAAGSAQYTGSTPSGRPAIPTLPLGAAARPTGATGSQGLGAGGAHPGGVAAANERRRRLSEMDFDIGTESPLERVWAREGNTAGTPRTEKARRYVPSAAV